MKYEYKCVSLSKDMDDLNHLGKYGWRLVSVVSSIAIMERVEVTDSDEFISKDTVNKILADINDDTKPVARRVKSPKLT